MWKEKSFYIFLLKHLKVKIEPFETKMKCVSHKIELSTTLYFWKNRSHYWKKNIFPSMNWHQWYVRSTLERAPIEFITRQRQMLKTLDGRNSPTRLFFHGLFLFADQTSQSLQGTSKVDGEKFSSPVALQTFLRSKFRRLGLVARRGHQSKRLFVDKT